MLVAYSMEKMATIREMTIEKVLTYDVGDDRRKSSRSGSSTGSRRRPGGPPPCGFTGRWLNLHPKWKSFSSSGWSMRARAYSKPLDWGAELLPYLRTQTTAYPPNFTSTMDPYKIFFFKYKAPLPAYLLRDMEKYREEYDQLSIEMTPHNQKQIELKIPDLFPETAAYKRALRMFALAASPCVQSHQEQDGLSRREERARCISSTRAISGSAIS